MESDTYGRVTDWNEVIKKEARGSDNADLGKVQEVNKDFIITERGTITKEMFYLPKSIPHGYNGRILLPKNYRMKLMTLLELNICDH